METVAIETLEREKEQGKADLAAQEVKCNDTANNLIKTKEDQRAHEGQLKKLR